MDGCLSTQWGKKVWTLRNNCILDSLRLLDYSSKVESKFEQVKLELWEFQTLGL